MSMYVDLCKLNPNDPEHMKLVVLCAKTKAKHDVTRARYHRKDSKVLETLLEYRRARNAVREAGDKYAKEREEGLNEHIPSV